MKPGTLPFLLFRSAEEYPDHGIGYVRHDHTVAWESYPQLLDHSLRLLTGLRARGLKQGDRVILSLAENSEILPVIWACLLGGIVPALLQPPVSFAEFNPAAEKARHVFRLMDSPSVIVSHRHLRHWDDSGIPGDYLIDISTVHSGEPARDLPEVSPDDLAMLQFSSGSTGFPKGVMLTHRNIEVNTRDIIKGIRLTPEDVSVSWMPLYHDMGLVGFHFTPLRTGVNQHFIEPVDFIKNPFLWLDIISGKRVTITACPNFGQSIVSRSLKRKKGHAWDLSSVRVMFNGAEPISVATMNEFTSLMKDHGFRPDAMFPAYGMAEATLAITFPPLDIVPEVVTFDREQLFRKGRAVVAETGDTSGVKLVNLGTPLDHSDLRITSASRNPLPEGCAGRVMVTGENITPGYYNDPATTRDSKHQGWLNTGDLGFMHNGCLFILGRVKDIIFVNGMNYYSHDLENVAERLEGIPAQKVVIAGYFDENSRRDRILLFLVAPDDEGTLETFRLLKTHFLNSIGLLIDTFIPVRSADIPRTSSGKIQRYKMVERFLRGEFEEAVKQI